MICPRPYHVRRFVPVSSVFFKDSSLISLIKVATASRFWQLFFVLQPATVTSVYLQLFYVFNTSFCNNAWTWVVISSRKMEVKHTAMWDKCIENVPAVHAYSKKVRSMVVCDIKIFSPNHRAMTSQILLIYLEGPPIQKTAVALLIFTNNTEWQHWALSASVTNSINLIFTGPVQQRCPHTSCLALLRELFSARANETIM